MPRESAQKASRAWLEEHMLIGGEEWDDGVTVNSMAEVLEDYARAWAKELGVAWDRRGERAEEPGPGVPVLQPQFDELIEQLATYQRAVEAGGDGTPPGLLVIAVAELKKRLAGYEAERCEICGARFSESRAERPEDDEEWYRDLQCHPCVENQRLRDQVAAHERDIKDATGQLMVEIPEPGTVTAKLLVANVLMRRQVADLLAGADRGNRLVAAEDLLRDMGELATTADDERMGQIIRKWAVPYRKFTPFGAMAALLSHRVREDGSVETVEDCPECEGRGNFPEMGHGSCLAVDCVPCGGMGRVPA